MSHHWPRDFPFNLSTYFFYRSRLYLMIDWWLWWSFRNLTTFRYNNRILKTLSLLELSSDEGMERVCNSARTLAWKDRVDKYTHNSRTRYSLHLVGNNLSMALFLTNLEMKKLRKSRFSLAEICSVTCQMV